MKIIIKTNIVFVLLWFCSACSNNDKSKATSFPAIPFNKALWQVKNKEGNDYVHRSRMIDDLLNNYEWKGVSKDSVINMLGEPSAIEENSLFYNYSSKPMIFGTANESIVFQLSPDGKTVVIARESDGGFD